MLQGTGETAQRAKSLRQAMSSPEIGLWLALRERPVGLKFRRQHPSGPYVADFYCHEARLVIEIDGSAHDCGDRPERDAVRDRWFAERGLRVFRVPARNVLADCDGVVRGIVALATEHLTGAD